MKTLCLALAAVIALTGCSFSKSARQQRAYEKYIRKSSVARAKQQSRFRPSKSNVPTMPSQMEPSEPVESVQTGPESMSSDSQ